MTFRFILQPIMATIAALYNHMSRDAPTGRAPYLWTIASNPAERGGRLREGLISTARVILLGLCMDAVYQIIEFDAFHPWRRSSSRSCWPLSPTYFCAARAHVSRAGGTALHLRRKSSEGVFMRLSLSEAQQSPNYSCWS